MGAVTVPLYHFAILKGYLLGQHAPAEVLVAADALHMAAVQGPLRDDALEAIRRVTDAAEKLIALAGNVPPAQGAIAVPSPAPAMDDELREFELPAITGRAIEKAGEVAGRPARSLGEGPGESGVEPLTGGRVAAPCPPPAPPVNAHEAVSGDPQMKKRKEWSPEARAAAAERMRSRQAAGLMKRRVESVETAEEKVAPEPVEPTGARPFVEVPVERLQAVHNGYAGRRDPQQELAEEDWPDIRDMLEKKRRSVDAIASDYDVEFATMKRFIDRHLWSGNPAPGEAHASTR